MYDMSREKKACAEFDAAEKTGMVFLLGPKCPEMDEVEALLDSMGVPWEYALSEGERVKLNNFWKTTGRSGEWLGLSHPEITHCVECCGPYVDGGDIIFIHEWAGPAGTATHRTLMGQVGALFQYLRDKDD